jgi:acetoin utilization deacetylase AcuC-like enzyme
MRVFYSDQFPLPLPVGHRFPLEKYARLRERVLADPAHAEIQFCVPEPATDEQLLRVHSVEYLDKVKTGSLSEKEMRRIGFPWSPRAG